MAAVGILKSALVAVLVLASSVSVAQSPAKRGAKGKANEPAAGSADSEPSKLTEAEWLGEFEAGRLSIASRHAELATKFRDKEEVSGAVRHFRMAKSLDGANEIARVGLGYVKVDGVWVAGPNMLDYPAAVDESKLTESEREARRTALAKQREALKPIYLQETELGKTAGSTFLELGLRAKAAGLAGPAKRALQLASAYGLQRKDIAEARGFVAFGDEWLHPILAKQANYAASLLKEATVGTKPAEPDAQGPEISRTFHTKVDDTKFIAARSSRDEARATRLIAVGDGSIRLGASLLGTHGKRPFKADRFMVTEVETEADYKAWLDKFDVATGAQRVLHARSTNCIVDNPFGCISVNFGDDKGDDAAANSIAFALIDHSRSGMVTTPWVRLGFSYLMTTQLLGTTHIKRYELENESRTRDYSVDTTRKRKGLPYGPAEFRRLACEMVRIGEDISLAALSETKINDMTERHIAKSLTLLEFLLTAHPEESRVWLSKPWRGADRGLNALAEALGTDVAGVQARWEAWILEHY